MSDNNSIIPFGKVDPKAIQETIGITKQLPGDENSWYQFIGGLLFQGGDTGTIAADTNLTLIPFVLPMPKKILGIWAQVYGAGGVNPPGVENYSWGITPIDLTSFYINNDGAIGNFWWLAIGY